jgi:hypothetical protein
MQNPDHRSRFEKRRAIDRLVTNEYDNRTWRTSWGGDGNGISDAALGEVQFDWAPPKGSFILGFVGICATIWFALLACTLRNSRMPGGICCR